MERLFSNSGIADFYAVPHSAIPTSLVAKFGVLKERLSIFGPNCWIAGGAIRDIVAATPSVDTDVFFPSDDALQATRSRLLEGGFVSHVELDVTNVWRAKANFGRVDLVRRAFRDPLFTVQAFDIVACCAALSATHFVYHRDFFADSAAKRLRINALPEPRATLRRVKRLSARGWAMSAEDFEWLEGEAAKCPADSADEYSAWE